MSHPKHPKCPECGRSLYKSPKKGARVARADPWAWCRNVACGLSGKDLSNGVVGDDPADGDSEEGKAATRATFDPPPPAPTKSHARRRGRPTTKQKAPEEPEAVAKARERIRGLVKAAANGAPAESVGLVLAILNQETGHTAAANALIDEYGLDKRFGLRRFER